MEEHRLLAGAGEPDDHGAPDPALTAALTAYDADPAREPEVLAALAAARLLVPVVATPGPSDMGEREVGAHGVVSDRSAEMATVLMVAPDGRRALLAFTSLDTLQQWDADARPVPVSAETAALAALQDGAVALLIDVAGPVTYVASVSHAPG